jgi:hypothetical protein
VKDIEENEKKNGTNFLSTKLPFGLECTKSEAMSLGSTLSFH